MRLALLAAAAAALLVAPALGAIPSAPPATAPPPAADEAQEAPGAPRPLVMAHRGGAGEAPENTMIAFERALGLGVDVLEMDVQWTADLVPVVIHDATLDRTSIDCDGPVNARTYEQVAACDVCATPEFCAKYGVARVPTLFEVLARFEHEPVALNIELKNIPTELPTFDPLDRVLLPRVIELVRAHPGYLPDRILLSSFNFKTTTLLKEMAPEIPVALLTPNPADAHVEAGVAAATRLDAIQPTHDALRAQNARLFVTHAHDLGLDVHVWTVDDAARMRELAEAGVDGIITNFPTRALDTFGR